MAVPKKKTSQSRKRSRKAANMKYSAPGYVKCPQCQEPKLPHRVCGECGYYKGEEVVAK